MYKQARQGDIHVQLKWVHCTFHNLFAFLFSLIWDSSTSSTPSRYSWLLRRGRIAWKIEANYIQFTCDSNGEWKRRAQRNTMTRLFLFIHVTLFFAPLSFNSIKRVILMFIASPAFIYTCFINGSSLSLAWNKKFVALFDNMMCISKIKNKTLNMFAFQLAFMSNLNHSDMNNAECPWYLRLVDRKLTSNSAENFRHLCLLKFKIFWCWWYCYELLWWKILCMRTHQPQTTFIHTMHCWGLWLFSRNIWESSVYTTATTRHKRRVVSTKTCHDCYEEVDEGEEFFCHISRKIAKILCFSVAGCARCGGWERLVPYIRRTIVITFSRYHLMSIERETWQHANVRLNTLFTTSTPPANSASGSISWISILKYNQLFFSGMLAMSERRICVVIRSLSGSVSCDELFLLSSMRIWKMDSINNSHVCFACST